MVIKKIVFFVFIIFSLFIINDLVHSIYNLWQKNNLIDRGKYALSVEKDKNKELNRRLKVVTQPQFVEEEARNKLFLVKPGEGIVVVAPTEYLRVSSNASVELKDVRPYWKQWWEAFF